MDAVAGGDKDAVAPLYSVLLPIAESSARRRLPRDADWQDVAQRALVRLFEEAPSWRPDGDVRAWCLALVYWECRTELKRLARQRPRQQDIDNPALATALVDPRSPEDEVLDAEFAHEKSEFLEVLTPEERATLGLGDAAILTALDGLSPATLRKRKQRLVDRLKRTWSTLSSQRIQS